VSQNETTQSLAQSEAAWLGWLQQQANTIVQAHTLSADRVATNAEMSAFFEGLQLLENACATADEAAGQLAAAGYHQLAGRLAAIRADIQGARNAFNQPPSTQPGPFASQMLELRDVQQRVHADSAAAGQLIAQNPALAAAQLADVFERSERMYDAQSELLRKMPWGAAELAPLQADRLQARVMILQLQGLAAVALANFDAARQFYERALIDVDPRDPVQSAALQQAILDVDMARMAHRGHP